MKMALDQELEELNQIAINTDTGDHDVFAHYVEKDEVTEALVNGWPVVALCGKIWVPFRDPSKYPICPICEEILADMTSSS